MRQLPASLVAFAALCFVPAALWAQPEQDPGKPAEQQAVEPPPITTLPRLLERVEAVFPEAARVAGVEQAIVVLDIDIDVQGRVENVTVVEPAVPAGYGFDEAALQAVQAFTFSPALSNDEPIPVRVAYRYDFVLQAASANAALPTAEEPPEPVVNFHGELLVRGTREPIAGVVVTVFQGSPNEATTAFEATSDAEGKFAFQDLEPGTWNVLVEAEGYFPVRTDEQVEAGHRTEVTYYVERGSYNPYDVLVEASRPRKEVSRTSIQTEELERIPGTVGDVLSVIQNMPGVARPPQPGLLIVRGSAPEDTQTVVQGMAVPLIYHFGGLRTVIPTPVVKGLDFYPGNFSAEFGRATGGVIDVRLKDLSADRLEGILDVSLIDTSLYVKAPLGDKGAIAVAGRRSYLDVLINAAASSFENLSVVAAPRYYDTQVLASYTPAEGHRLRLFGLYSDDRVELLFTNPGDLSLSLDSGSISNSTAFARGIVEYEYTPTAGVSNLFRVSLGDESEDFEIAQLSYLREQQTLQVRENLRVALTGQLQLHMGVDYLAERSTYDVTAPLPDREGDGDVGGAGELADPVSTLIEGVWSHSIGLFAEAEWTLWQRLLLIPGVRYDRFSRTDSHRVAPRLTTRLQLSPEWTAKGGVGLYYQEPTFDETDETFGNPDAGPEGAVHYSLGVEYRPLEYLSFDLTGFYKNLYDLVASTDAVVERDGALVPLNVDNTGTGRVYGLELLARHRLSNNFTGWVSYTLMRSERKDAVGEDTRLFDYDQTHILTVLGTYKLPRNWEVGFRFRLVSGTPTTPVVGAAYDADADAYEPVAGAVNAERIPAFHQLDIRIDKHWIFDTWRFSAYLDIQNVYNRANPNTASYNFDYSEQSYSQSLPILPILGLRAEY